MGTRGAFGWRYQQKDYITYNHYDSYPEGLGADVVEYVNQHFLTINDFEPLNDKTYAHELLSMRQAVRDMEFIDKDAKPTGVQKDRAESLGTVDLTVSECSMDDWYCLTRRAQGDPEKLLALGFMDDGQAFLLESMSCEFAYIINLDTEELEFYTGFNHVWDAAGRYAALAKHTRIYPDGRTVPNEYAGVRLVGTCPLRAVPADWLERFFPEEL